jgi:putative protease
MYVWNREAGLELLDSNTVHATAQSSNASQAGDGNGFMISEFTVPYELSFAEMKDMTKALKNTVDIPISYNSYGHLPMMISAGCIKKTTDKCSGKLHELHSEQLTIIDRMNNTLPVTCNCRSCYNVIWNAHPTSLHKRLDKVLLTETINNLRLDFTVESGKRTGEVLQYYIDRLNGAQPEDIFKKEAFTAGHFARGVE